MRLYRVNSNTHHQPLRNWIPYRLTGTDEQLLFRWLHVGDHRFTEPFFDETVAHCKQYPYNSTRWQSVSTLSGLLDAAQTCLSVPPSAFIFHVSRCGSTLLSQLLAISERHIMLSEMPLIDEVLRLPDTTPSLGVSEEERKAALKAIIHLLGAKRSGEENRLFVKLDSWNLFFYKTLRQLYPDVPFVLLYRSPDAVIRSHQKRRGMQAVPGLIEPELFGFNREDVRSMDEYTAAVLERYFQTMLTIVDTDTNLHLLNYQADGSAILHELINTLQIDVSPEEMDQMLERSQYHSKYPNQPFSEIVPQESTEAYLQPVMTLYHQLNAKRTNTISLVHERTR
ncbi:sulfotransferase family protein [Spirosoma validum]|uniref:Sulfotransferase family protein n=1 Tax=Spirosoma validum TaxID=2771355 RepID=A0A927B5M9_9BACT|nr:sulfotransferase family protein [Spirosoma validum]MBD2755748.1 sulfotransferase family protein [Spirosoma validum]